MNIIQAARNGKLKELNKLIKSGVNINAIDVWGNAALIWAAWEGHTKCVSALIKANVDVNIKDSHGWTALACAAYKGYTQCVEKLLRAGADPNIESNNNNTALELAKSVGHIDCLNLLEQYAKKEPKIEITKVKLLPHLQKIVNYIRKHGSVTVREATLSKELNTVELRKRISEINRAKGYEFISGTYEPNRDGGQHKRYRLCK